MEIVFDSTSRAIAAGAASEERPASISMQIGADRGVGALFQIPNARGEYRIYSASRAYSPFSVSCGSGVEVPGRCGGGRRLESEE